MSVMATVAGVARRNPALAIAAVGVGGVLVLPAILNRGQKSDAEAAVAEQVYGPGYGSALTSGGGLAGLESGNIAQQIQEGNNALLGAISDLRRTMPTPTTTPLPATPAPGAPPPASGTGYVQPTPEPSKLTPTPAISTAPSLAELQKALTSIGAPASWATSPFARANSYVTASTSSIQAWARRYARDPKSGYQLTASGQIVKR